MMSRFASKHGPVFWCHADQNLECEDIGRVFRNGHDWPYYRGQWYLYHDGNPPPQITECDPYEHHTIKERIEMFREMSASHAWTLCSWGREQSMAMVAFVTNNERYCDEFISCLGGFSSRVSQSGLFLEDITTSSIPTLLAVYKNIESPFDRWHGLLFNDSETAERLWALTGFGRSLPYLLHFQQTGPNADPRCLPIGNGFQPRWGFGHSSL